MRYTVKRVPGMWSLSYLQKISSFLLFIYGKPIRNNDEILFLSGSGKQGQLLGCSWMRLYKSLPSCVFCRDKQTGPPDGAASLLDLVNFTSKKLILSCSFDV